MERRMDKQTSEKLMGAIGEGHSSAKTAAPNTESKTGQSSDMSFYVIMLALIVGMGFYISYDMEQRYGSTSSSAAAPMDSEPAQEGIQAPVVVNIEKVKTVEVKPLAVIPATETTPEAVVVEKIVPVEEKSEVVIAPVVQKVAAPLSPPAASPSPSSLMMPVMESAMQAADVVAAPVVEAVTDVVAEPVAEPAQAYNPYGYQYGQPQNNYYQPQYGNPYGNPYSNQYGNPYGNQYGNPYSNQYGNPYGYGNNPYQQPAAQPAQ